MRKTGTDVRDRTREFAATIESLYSRSAAGIVGMSGMDPLLGTATPRSPRHEQSEFTCRAREINNSIQRALVKLEKLTKRKSLRVSFGVGDGV